ncbi:Melanoma inhibitory activity protein 2 [Plecturocebus cupreus]
MFQIHHLADKTCPIWPLTTGSASSEMRAFLSPPTSLEGEEEEAQEAQGILWTTRLNERGESSSDMLADSHRGPSDTGPLSPLWEKELLEMIFHQGFPRSTTCSICNTIKKKKTYSKTQPCHIKIFQHLSKLYWKVETQELLEPGRQMLQ